MLIVLTVLLVGAAMAGDVDYKIYGVAHASVDYLDNGADSSVFIASNSTRLGIKGFMETDTEFDMIFKYEQNANFNGEGTNTLSSRDSWVGLKHADYGSLVFGRHNTPFKLIGYRAFNITNERISDYRNMTSYWGENGWDVRMANSMTYTSPEIMDAAKVMLQVVPEEGNVNGFFVSTALEYKKDEFYAGVAYETHGKANEPGFMDKIYDDNGDVVDTYWDSEVPAGLRLSAKYDDGEYMVGSLFQMISNNMGYENFDVTVWGLVGAYTVDNKWCFKAHYMVADQDLDSVTDDVLAFIDSDNARLWDENNDRLADPKLDGGLLSLGVDYLLTKTTKLYVTYATTMAGDDTYYMLGRGGHGQSYGWTGEAGEQWGESQMGISCGLHTTW